MSHHDLSQRLISGSFWLLLDRFTRMGFGFLVGVVLARSYGPDGFGQISYVISVTSLFGAFASFGLDDLIPRDLAAHDRKTASAEILWTGMVLRVLAQIVAYLALIAFVGGTQGTATILGFTALYGLYYFTQVTDLFEFDRRVQGRFAPIVKLRSGASCASSALKIACASFGFPLLSVAGAMLFEYLIPMMAYSYQGLRQEFWRKKKWCAGYAGALCRRAPPLILSAFLTILQSRIDALMVERYLGFDALGGYAAALRMVELLDALGITGSILLTPELARIKENELKFVARSAYFWGTLVFFAMSPLLIGIHYLFPMIYGEEFKNSQMLIPLFALRPYVSILAGIRLSLLLAKHRYGLIPLYPALGTILTFTGGMYGVPTGGIRAIAWAGVLGPVMAVLIIDLFWNRWNLVQFVLSPTTLMPYLTAKVRR